MIFYSPGIDECLNIIDGTAVFPSKGKCSMDGLTEILNLDASCVVYPAVALMEQALGHAY